MSIRLRKFIGTVVLLVFIPTYTLVAVAAAGHLLPGTNGLLQLTYYAVAGLLWILPAGAIITWMVRPSRVAER